MNGKILKKAPVESQTSVHEILESLLRRKAPP
jgi:hypothetical protein